MFVFLNEGLLDRENHYCPVNCELLSFNYMLFNTFSRFLGGVDLKSTQLSGEVSRNTIPENPYVYCIFPIVFVMGVMSFSAFQRIRLQIAAKFLFQFSMKHPYSKGFRDAITKTIRPHPLTRWNYTEVNRTVVRENIKKYFISYLTFGNFNGLEFAKVFPLSEEDEARGVNLRKKQIKFLKE